MSNPNQPPVDPTQLDPQLAALAATPDHESLNQQDSEPGFEILDEEFNSITAAPGESLEDAQFNYVYGRTAHELRAKGVEEDYAGLIAGEITLNANAVRILASGRQLSDDYKNNLVASRYRLDILSQGATNARPNGLALSEAIENAKFGAMSPDNSTAAFELKDMLDDLQDPEAIERRKNDPALISDAEFSALEPTTDKDLEQLQAEYMDAKVVDTLTKNGISKEDAANLRVPMADLALLVRQVANGAEVTPETYERINELRIEFNDAQDEISGDENKIAAAINAAFNASIGAKASEISKQLSDNAKNFEKGIDPQPLDFGPAVVDMPESYTKTRITNEINSNPELKDLKKIMEEQRRNYARSSAKRRTATLGSHKKDVETSRKKYEDSRNNAGAMVAEYLRNNGFTEKEISQFAVMGAILEAHTLSREVVKQEIDVAGKYGFIVEKWAKNTRESAPNTGLLKQVVQQVTYKGNIKKALAVGLFGAAAGAAAGAVFGVGIAGATTALVARSASRHMVRNHFDRAVKNLNSEAHVVDASVGVDAIGGSLIRDPAVHDTMAYHRNFEVDPASLTTEHLTNFVDKQTNMDVSGNRRRLAISTGLAVATGGLAAKLTGLTDNIEGLRKLGQLAKDVKNPPVNSGPATGYRAPSGVIDGTRSAEEIKDSIQRPVTPRSVDGIVNNAPVGTKPPTDTARYIDDITKRLQSYSPEKAASVVPADVDTTKLESVARQLANPATTELRSPILSGMNIGPQLQNMFGINEAQSQLGVEWLLKNGYINADGSGGIPGVKGTSIDTLVTYANGAGDGQLHMPRSAAEGLLKFLAQNEAELAKTTA
jgi:hypothetical protein